MVYPKKTWITNEVITTTALNNIENGVETASKLSGTDIDADKNWNGKAITNVGRVSAQKYASATYVLIPTALPKIGGICYSNDGYVWVSGWTTVKTAPPVPTGRSGTVSVTYNAVADSTGPVSARLLKNGVVVDGSTISAGANDSASNTMQIPVVPGDVLAVQTTLGNSAFSIAASMIPEIDIGTLAW